MRIPFLFLSVIGLRLIVGGCTKATPEYHTYATIKDLMDSVVDPSADFIWDSVSTTSNLKGIVEKAPKTDEEWRDVRRHAIALMEATDLLQMPGRTVARPGEKAADPRIELDPSVIQTMIDADRASWADHTRALYDATVLIIRSPADYDAYRAERELLYERLPLEQPVFDRAIDVQQRLSERAEHRAVPLADLVIAAAAELHGLTVLHYDADFDRIAKVTGQQVEWIVPRGSAD